MTRTNFYKIIICLALLGMSVYLVFQNWVTLNLPESGRPASADPVTWQAQELLEELSDSA